MVSEHIITGKLKINIEGTDTSTYIDLNKSGIETEVMAYPNPFSNSITFSYELKNSEHVSLLILDLNGKIIQTLSNYQLKGLQSIIWNSADCSNKYLLTGNYLYNISIGDRQYTGKIIYLK